MGLVARGGLIKDVTVHTSTLVYVLHQFQYTTRKSTG